MGINKQTNQIYIYVFTCIFFILYGLVIFYPYVEVNFLLTVNIFNLNAFDLRRIAQVTLLIIIPVFVIYNNVLKIQIFNVIKHFPAYIKICLAVYVFSITIGALISIAPLQSMMVVAQQLLSIFAIFITAALCANNKNTRKLIVAWFLTIVFMYICLSFYGYVSVVGKKGIGFYTPSFRQDILLYFTNIRYLTQWLTWMLPLVGFALFLNINKVLKVIIYMALIYLWVLALAVQSRAFMIEWLLIFLVLSIIYRRNATKYLAYQLSACIIGAILCESLGLFPVLTKDIKNGSVLFICLYIAIWSCNILLSGNNLEKFFSFKKYRVIVNTTLLIAIGLIISYVCYTYQNRIVTIFHDNARIQIWLASLEIFFQGKWLGVGSGILPLYGIKMLHTGQLVVVAQPHNFLIRLLVDNGLIGFITLLIPILYGIYFVVKKCWNEARSNNYSPLKIALLATLIGAVVHAQVSGLMETPLSQLTAIIVIGIMLYEFSNKEYSDGYVKNYSTLAMSIIITVAVLFSAYLSISTYFSIKNIENIQNERICRDELNPYYWMDGSIVLDYPGEYFCSRNYQELKYWSIYGPYQIRFEDN